MANFNYNKIMLGGHLTADPELRSTQSGVQYAAFTIAVTRRYRPKEQGEPQSDFIRCVTWRSQAEFVTKHFKRGSSIFVEGELLTRSWTDQRGQKQYSNEVNVDEVYFVDSKGNVAKTESVGEPAEGGNAPDVYEDVYDDEMTF